jgi:hypothetical protein
MSITVKTNSTAEQTVEVRVRRPNWQEFIVY